MYNSNSVCQKWKSVEEESLFSPHDRATAHQDGVTDNDVLKVGSLNIIFRASLKYVNVFVKDIRNSQ